MIKHFHTIKNVGKFAEFIDSSNLRFGKLNVIYAENGRGKTTISHILRSLRTGDNNPILERSTVDNKEEPLLRIIGDNWVAEFNNGTWNMTFPLIEIFDSTFVNENICSGHYLDVEQKRQLYRFVIGDEGVRLSTQIDELSDNISQLNADLKHWESEIRRFIHGSLTIKEFVNLEAVSDIDVHIETKQREIIALKDKSEVIKRPFLKEIQLPMFPGKDFEQILTRRLEDVAEDAARYVREHMEKHLDSQGEVWILRGIDYLSGDICPFCGQSVSLSELAQTYKAYFSEAYQEIKSETNEFLKNITNVFSDSQLRSILTQIQENEKNAEFWSKYVPIDYPTLVVKDVEETWEALTNSTTECLHHKIAAPLEHISPTIKYEEAFVLYETTIEYINEYNKFVKSINSELVTIKSGAEQGDLSTVEEELTNLMNVKQRHESDTAQYCDEYLATLKDKAEKEKDKKYTRKNLNKFTSETFGKYEATLNTCLENFLTGFQIQNNKPRFSGGKASVNYSIKLRDVTIELGDAKTEGIPSFRTVLSEGDKNTLALAFFMSRLDQLGESGLKDKTVVFDDPVSSLDRYRRTRTQEKINSICTLAGQVFVLSHDIDFLKEIWDAARIDDKQSFQIIRHANDDSWLSEWNIEHATRPKYFDDFDTLLDYLENGVIGDDGQLRNVASRIRPLLEAYFKMRFPKDIPLNKPFGKSVLDKIEKAQINSPLHHVKSQLEELRKINDYASKYHHAENGNFESEAILDQELKDYVKRAIDFIYKNG